jgi:four helix bundle protein
MGFAFRNTELYRLAIEYNREVKRILKETKPGRSVTDQFTRAVGSIILNIAEGFGRFHKPDKRHYYIMARGSVFECVACSDLVYDFNPPEEFLEKSETIGKILSGLIKKFSD